MIPFQMSPFPKLIFVACHLREKNDKYFSFFLSTDAVDFSYYNLYLLYNFFLHFLVPKNIFSLEIFFELLLL